MTGGNRTHPHPPEVSSDADLADWAQRPEANAGAVAFNMGRPQTQKFMQDVRKRSCSPPHPPPPSVQSADPSDHDNAPHRPPVPSA